MATIQVISPDGRVGTIPEENLSKAIGAGFRAFEPQSEDEGRFESAVGAVGAVAKGGAKRAVSGLGDIVGAFRSETFISEQDRVVETPEGENRGLINRLAQAGMGLQKVGSGVLETVFSPVAAPVGFLEPEINKGIEFLKNESPEQIKDLIKRGAVAYEDLPADVKESLRSSLDTVGVRALRPQVATLKTKAPRLTEVAHTTTKAVAENLESAMKQQRLSFAEELVTPALSKKTREQLLKEGRVRETRIGTRFVEPSPREKRMAQIIAPIVKKSTGGGLDPVRNINRLESTIESNAKKIRAKLTGSGIEVNEGDMAGLSRALKAGMEEKAKILFLGDRALRRAYVSQWEQFKNIFKKYPDTAEGLWDARIELDNSIIQIKKERGLDFSEKMNVQKIATKDIRDHVNELVHRKALDAGLDFADELDRLSLMYGARDIIAAKTANEYFGFFKRTMQAVRRFTGGDVLTAAGVLGASAFFAPQVVVPGALLFGGSKVFAGLYRKSRGQIVKAMRHIEGQLEKKLPAAKRESLKNAHKLLAEMELETKILESKAIPLNKETSPRAAIPPVVGQGTPPGLLPEPPVPPQLPERASTFATGTPIPIEPTTKPKPRIRPERVKPPLK